MAGQLRYPILQAVLLVFGCTVLPSHGGAAWILPSCPRYADRHGELPTGIIGSSRMPKCYMGNRLISQMPSFCHPAARGKLTWTRQPWCTLIPDFCRRKSVQGGYVRAGALLEKASIQCNNGYTLRGGHPYTCHRWSSTAGRWLPGAGTCQPTPGYCKRMNVTGGYIQAGVVSETASIQCHPGYTLSAGAPYTCSSGSKTAGTWTGGAGTCQHRSSIGVMHLDAGLTLEFPVAMRHPFAKANTICSGGIPPSRFLGNFPTQVQSLFTNIGSYLRLTSNVSVWFQTHDANGVVAVKVDGTPGGRSIALKPTVVRGPQLQTTTAFVACLKKRTV